MKPRTLPVKRNTVSKGIFKRLSAVTRSRKQRVAAASASADEFETDDHSSKISRALTIIFLIHIVVIGLIFFHQKFLDNGAPKTVAVSKAPVAAPREHELPKLSSGDAIYRVVAGDNYPRIAADHGIDEADLRAANNNVEIAPGLIMKIPPKKIVAVSPELAALREAPATPSIDQGLVEAIPVNGQQAPRAVVVKPNTPAPARTVSTSAPAASGKGTKYVVQSGDNIWRIANRFKVDQNALMKANGISDPKKLKLGMSLVIPN
jgi:LysM repeat protein